MFAADHEAGVDRFIDADLRDIRDLGRTQDPDLDLVLVLIHPSTVIEILEVAVHTIDRGIGVDRLRVEVVGAIITMEGVVDLFLDHVQILGGLIIVRTDIGIMIRLEIIASK